VRDIGEYARQRAAALDPARSDGRWAAAAIARAGLSVVIVGWTIIAALGGLGLLAVARGIGLMMVVTASTYVVISARMWWWRLVLHRPMHWAPRPAGWIVVCAWAGSVIVIATFMHPSTRVYFDIANLTGWLFLILTYGTPVLLAVALAAWIRSRRSQASGLQIHVSQRRSGATAARSSRLEDWGISLGSASGFCREKNDERGLYAGEPVALSLIDASRGLLICGSPGGGKTTQMRLLARQVTSLPKTALVAISAKRDDARSIAAMFPNPRVVGPGHEPFNIFAGLSAEAIGATFGELAGDPRSRFWASAVANLNSAWLQICRGLAGTTVVVPEVRGSGSERYEPERIYTITYSPQSLSDLLYAPDRLANEVLIQASRRLPALDGIAHEQLAAGLAYFSGEYQATLATARGETLGSVRASVSPYLRALLAPGFVDAFGTGDMDLASAIDNGEQIIIDVDMAENPQGYAVVAALIVAHLRRIALARTARDAAANNPCLVLMDEAATYISRDTLALFETCRQARLACVVSIIGLSNLQALLGDAAAYAVPAALGSLVCFATGDGHTRKYVTERIGSVRSREVTSGTSSGRHPQVAFIPSSQYSTSEHYVTQPIIDDEAWANLGVHPELGYASAVAILAQGGHIAHDVIMVHA
jgi:hypothetical protein